MRIIIFITAIVISVTMFVSLVLASTGLAEYVNSL